MGKRSSIASHRARMARAGFVRAEISVRKEDAPLVRGVAAALSDPSRRIDARALLRQRFSAPAKLSLKALGVESISTALSRCNQISDDQGAGELRQHDPSI